LYTDIEGSTRIWEQHPEAARQVVSWQDQILREAIDSHGGTVFRTVGDGLCAVFTNASNALAAALDAQTEIQMQTWEKIGILRVRMALHTGEVEARGDDFSGSSLNRMGRLLSVTHGGQTLLSHATQLLVRGTLPAEVELIDLGEIRLRDLSYPEHVFQLSHPKLIFDFPPLASLDRRPNNLPTQPTILIGREKELADILERLESREVRLLTLTGPGGTGKTRLALQASAELIDRFTDGVFFVDLASARDPDAVVAAIARTVGLRETNDQPLLDTLKDHLRERSMLLLLDNFEQVTVAAPQMAGLLLECPHLKLLVTSREALQVRSEHIYPIPPLKLPEVRHKRIDLEQLTQYEAVRLFIERARAVKPDFQVTNENAPAVAEICIRLDGLPLAIELATARINLFSPQALLDRLENRMKILQGGARDLPARQQTIWDTIDWSYELLERGEQRLFELLSVFSGCSIEAVEAIVGRIDGFEEERVDALDGLSSLLGKSLIRKIDQNSGEPRFLMLETIREYAGNRLEQNPEFAAYARRAHAAYYADFAQSHWEWMAGSGRESALREMEVDLENLLAAWRFWIGEKDLEQLGKMIDSLWLFYDAHGWYRGTIELTTSLLAVVASLPPSPERTRQEIVLQTSLARALLALKGPTEEVEQAYQRALGITQHEGEIPQVFPVLRGLSSYYLYRAEYQRSAQIGEQILALAERLEDPVIRVEGHLVLGASLSFTNELDQGMEHLEKAIAEYDPDQRRASPFRLGNDPGVVARTTSALLLWMYGFPDRAVKRSDEALALAERLGHPITTSYALFHTGLLRLWRGEVDIALERAQALLELASLHEFQIWIALGNCLYGAGQAATARAAESLDHIQKGMDLYQGLHTPPVFWPLLLHLKAEALGRAGEPREGLAVLEVAITAAGTDPGNSLAAEFFRLKAELLLALSPENQGEAEAWLIQGLHVVRESGARMLELRSALSLAKLWRSIGKYDQSRELLQEAYGKMTEGFNIPNLREARRLLEEWA
jgi:predicted ATPase